MHAAFNVLDSDRDGFVTKHDFRKKFHNLNANQIDIVFNKYDSLASNGKLSFVEFKNFMSRRPLPINLESRRHSILSLPASSSLSSADPPRYSSLSLYPPRYSSLGGGRRDSLESTEEVGDRDTFLTDDDEIIGENHSSDMLRMSNDVSMSIENLTISPAKDFEENKTDILKTISEEVDDDLQHNI